MELLFWLLSACAALWFLDVFGNGFWLNSDNGSHEIFSSKNLFRFGAFKQHSTGNNISSFATLNIDIALYQRHSGFSNSSKTGPHTLNRNQPILQCNPNNDTVNASSSRNRLSGSQGPHPTIHQPSPTQ